MASLCVKDGGDRYRKAQFLAHLKEAPQPDKVVVADRPE